MTQDWRTWLAQVDIAMERLYGIDHVDAGWDRNDIERYFGFGNPPLEFAEWYGAKYGLDEKDAWT